jgi:hypothetical protein
MAWLKTVRWPALTAAAVAAAAALVLHAQGRPWWCACGRPALWWGDVHSAHNSQHLFDPYSFTHLLHGVALYGLLTWAAPRLPLAWKIGIVIGVEAGWEVLENSAFVVRRYRAATAALGYEGDSVANSLGDMLSGAVGAALAARLGLWRSVALFVVVEAALLLAIRDSLLLNVVMLIHPVEAIRAWQLAG